MNAADIRDLFRDFFVDRGHLAGEPASLVPAGDTSVLFTTAGMQQYKPYFLGVETPPSTRITTCQRSFRTSDVENVGKTARHLTFFEMLGNFSFGDYFKTEAIQWSLELSDQLGIPRDKVWVSVFGGDDQVPADEEAVEMWKAHGFTDDRIVRLGRSDNFWGPAGPTGPCGPCSELYYDFGPEMGCDDPECKPGCDCDRYLEYWNLVFVQYDMDEAGNLTPLPKGSIDTGMGLERIASISQGVTNVFDTDLFEPLVAARRRAGRRHAGLVAGRHARPAHHGRARPRRVVPHHGRRAARQRRPRLRAAAHHPARRPAGGVHRRRQAVPRRRSPTPSSTQMKSAYPGLVDAQPEIRRVVDEEEVRFRRTLEQGMGILEEALRRARDAGTELPAEVAFELHDTYGFPFDLTREIAAEQDMTVDEERFGHLMEEQRERARSAQKEGTFASGPGEVEDFQRRYAEERVRVRRLRAARGVHRGARHRRAQRRPPGRQARRVAVLRRGRRADRRHRLDPHRLRQARGRERRQVRRRPGHRRAARSRARSWRASAPRPWSTPCGATRRPATTRRRTCCTTPCASCSASPCARPVRW